MKNKIIFGGIPDEYQDIPYVDYASKKILSMPDIYVTIAYSCPTCDRDIVCAWSDKKIVDKIVDVTLDRVKNNKKTFTFQCPECKDFVEINI